MLPLCSLAYYFHPILRQPVFVSLEEVSPESLVAPVTYTLSTDVEDLRVNHGCNPILDLFFITLQLVLGAQLKVCLFAFCIAVTDKTLESRKRSMSPTHVGLFLFKSLPAAK
jgi:hypothetical protein